VGFSYWITTPTEYRRGSLIGQLHRENTDGVLLWDNYTEIIQMGVLLLDNYTD
jgi:hypothetical protein